MPINQQARGSFAVQLAAQAPSGEVEAAGPARMTIAKQFSGDLQGASKGQMLAWRTSVSGSAAYVAIENVTANLHGRSGSFALLHKGQMRSGAGELEVSVVPDSATGELTGLTGTMRIDIVDGEHRYQFDYQLP